MCGIVGAVAQRDVVEILMDGLHRLEYRGYDSAGIATVSSNCLSRVRAQGKVANLQKQIESQGMSGSVGIAHTRWATHGQPSEQNAHPHIGGERIVLVHNGIIENYHELLHKYDVQDSDLSSETDSEAIAACLSMCMQQDQGLDLFKAMQALRQELIGAYAIAAIDVQNPTDIVLARCGSPLVIGLGIGEYFIASDPLALQKVAQEFIYLEDGDCARLTCRKLEIINQQNQVVKRAIHVREFSFDAANKDDYKHYMHKEIHEQPQAIRNTIERLKYHEDNIASMFGEQAKDIFSQIKQLHLIACGTSYHAALIGKHWLESSLRIPCLVEIASEYRYSQPIILPNTLLICISQSGETADTLAALRQHGQHSHILATLGICNVPGSSLTRETHLCFLTQAGPEVGVATTKGFTTQLVALLLLKIAIKQSLKQINDEQKTIYALKRLPLLMEELLQQESLIEHMANQLSHKRSTLFLGRGIFYPLALEAALKLKEISYIHAEAYPAGELKHGPLALVDDDMPVIVFAPDNALLGKLKANMREILARGGQLLIIGCTNACQQVKNHFKMKTYPNILLPLLYSIPLQLLAYHVAVNKGTDVDKPRNLAKSVTVE